METENEIEERLIVRYMEGTITPDEMELLEQWLNESETHRQLFIQLKQIDELKQERTLSEAEVQESWNRLQPKLRASRRIIPLSFLKYAAVAVVAVLLTMGVQRWYQGTPTLQSAVINTDRGAKISSLVLPDGTKVTLNKASQLRYETDFGRKTRSVYLNGEALFDVAADKHHPFIVYSSKQRIEVLGTLFNVQDYDDEDFATTTLMRGSVKMQTEDSEGQYGKDIFLKPNQRLVFNRETHSCELRAAEIDSTKSWTNNYMQFDNDPFSHIMQRLEKIYDVTVVMKDTVIRNTRYSGTFAADQPVREVLDIINYDRQFAFQIKSDTIWIY